jgi:lipoate-protein ligase A
MKFLDLTLPTPAENLACDEALLDLFETNGGEGVLRFWEPSEHFVVVGYGNHVAMEVNVAACEAAKIPIFRRCSGGGTVLQGPGCLNYSLVARIEENGPLHSITSANRFIMERNREAIESTVESPQSTIKVAGHTDLAIRNQKFSGNAQRRKKHFLLFHGTFLLQFDIPLIGKFLRMPSKQPAYRESRTHKDFLINLNIDAGVVKDAFRKTWGAYEILEVIPFDTVASLARDNYVTNEWNFKF